MIPTYQKQGVGKMLLQKCIDRYPHVHFFTIADDDVMEFYEKSGFKLHLYGMYLEKGKKNCAIYN